MRALLEPAHLPIHPPLPPPPTPHHHPFQAAHALVNYRIRDFQEGVARRAAAQAADPRWFFQKAAGTLSSWGRARRALAAAQPSPWGAVVLLMIGSFVRSVVEQFAQVRARLQVLHLSLSLN